MAKNFTITLTVPSDDQIDMTDGDYTLEDFEAIAKDAIDASGWTKLGNTRIKAINITVKEDN